jgi:hypothetical protein
MDIEPIENGSMFMRWKLTLVAVRQLTLQA